MTFVVVRVRCRRADYDPDVFACTVYANGRIVAFTDGETEEDLEALERRLRDYYVAHPEQIGYTSDVEIVGAI